MVNLSEDLMYHAGTSWIHLKPPTPTLSLTQTSSRHKSSKICQEAGYYFFNLEATKPFTENTLPAKKGICLFDNFDDGNEDFILSPTILNTRLRQPIILSLALSKGNAGNLTVKQMKRNDGSRQSHTVNHGVNH